MGAWRGVPGVLSVWVTFSGHSFFPLLPGLLPQICPVLLPHPTLHARDHAVSGLRSVIERSLYIPDSIFLRRIAGNSRATRSRGCGLGGQNTSYQGERGRVGEQFEAGRKKNGEGEGGTKLVLDGRMRI